MSLVSDKGASFDEALALRPALQQKYRSFLAAIEGNDDVPARVLTLCRARVAQIHSQPVEGVSPEEAASLASGRFETFESPEQIAIRAAEKMPFQHHFLEDDEVDAIKSAFGEPGCVSLLTAIAFFDVSCRLNATLLKETN